MPIILNPDEMPVFDSGEGWTIRTLADGRVIGAPAMTARDWTLAAHGQGPKLTHGEVEQLL